MTTSELIQQLLQFPTNTPVFLSDFDNEIALTAKATIKDAIVDDMGDLYFKSESAEEANMESEDWEALKASSPAICLISPNSWE